MSGYEPLFALLLVCIVAGIAFVAAQVMAQSRRAETEAQRTAAQAIELAELKAQMAAGGRNQDAVAVDLRDRLTNTQSLLEGFRAALGARQQIDEDSRRSLRRLEAIIAGSSTRGAAGENILEEAIHHLPTEMIHRNAWINGKVVEFAVRMPGGKLMPLDSKWTSSLALEHLAETDLDAGRRAELVRQVEREVEKRIKEVGQYIDPACTTPWALAAIPDAAYSICRGAFAEAHKRNVIIVGFSMALPYLLALYHMHLQFSRSVDMENLQACLIDIERQVETIDSTLENKLQRAITMLQNTYAETKQASARINASTTNIQASERVATTPSLVLIGDRSPRPDAANQ